MPRYGSDAMVEALTTLGVELVALNPGATTRGLHESLVHAQRPEMILALHENVAVAVAEGYARTTQRPMAVMLHDLVGLQNGSMAIFNSWMDQTPILVLGGSGPANVGTRRPWIDWVHSAKQQSLLIRDYVKWTDEPVTVPAALDSLFRAYTMATTFPQGPVYVSLDAGLQETELADAGAPLVGSRPRFAGAGVEDDELARLADRLLGAEAPVFVADGTGRSLPGYQALHTLAEGLGARVVDLEARHNFSNRHWADATNSRWTAIAEADVVLTLDPRDATWALSRTDTEHRKAIWVPDPAASVNVISSNPLIPASFIDREPSPSQVDLVLTADSGLALPRLAELVGTGLTARHAKRADELRLAYQERPVPSANAQFSAGPDQPIGPAALAARLWDAVREGPWQLAYGSLYGWIRRSWEMTTWNCSLGRSVGGGLGYGAGASIGCALAHRDDDTLVVDVQPDGDLLYTASALWTAAHYKLPLLMVVANNRTYNQDRMHQEVISRARQRSDDVETGIDIADPDIDFTKIAEAQGIQAFGPVSRAGDLADQLEHAVAMVRGERRPVLVDVVTSRERR